VDKNFKLNLQLFADTTVSASLREKAWFRETWKAVEDNLFFKKFIGTSEQSIIQKITNLQKEPGDKVTIPLLLKLTGIGVLDGAILEGNEEAMQYRDFTAEVHQVRNAVRLAGEFDEQKTGLKMRIDAKNSLATWLSERIEGMFFSSLSASPTADMTVIAGAASEAAIAAGNKFTPALIGIAKRKAMMDETGMRPIRINGANHFVCVIDPYQARDLKANSDWNDAQKYANVRGNENPIFSGALGMWDGVVVHESEGVIRTATGASLSGGAGGNVDVGHALFMGAQAGVLVMAKDVKWKEKLFDYGDKFGVAISVILGVAKSVFKIDGTNNKDFACINILTSSVSD
jgi:N4-gp56 family major capsid protein